MPSVLRFIFVGVACLLLVVGCASSPSVRYYALSSLPAKDFTPAGDLLVGLGPLTLPEYLHRPQIVKRGRGNELLVDDFHRWGEDLEDSVPRIVAANLSVLLEAASVVELPTIAVVRPNYRVVGSIHQFDLSAQGEAVLIVQWSVSDGSQMIIGPLRHRYTHASESAFGANAEVAALNAVLEAFSRDIAAGINALRDANSTPSH